MFLFWKLRFYILKNEEHGKKITSAFLLIFFILLAHN